MEIKYDDVMKKLEEHLKDITPEQLEKELIEAGMGFYLLPDENDMYYIIKKSDVQRLLGKVNRVTSSHRHGLGVRKKDLTTLSNYQIDFEQMLEKVES